MLEFYKKISMVINTKTIGLYSMISTSVSYADMGDADRMISEHAAVVSLSSYFNRVILPLFALVIVLYITFNYFIIKKDRKNRLFKNLVASIMAFAIIFGLKYCLFMIINS